MFLGDFIATCQYNQLIDENRVFLNNFPKIPFNGIMNDVHLCGVVFYINGQNYHLYQDLMNFFTFIEFERPFVLNTDERNVIFNGDIQFESKLFLEFDEDAREDAFEEFRKFNEEFQSDVDDEDFFNKIGYEDKSPEEVMV
jgi:hypothetical protein